MPKQLKVTAGSVTDLHPSSSGRPQLGNTKQNFLFSLTTQHKGQLLSNLTVWKLKTVYVFPH